MAKLAERHVFLSIALAAAIVAISPVAGAHACTPTATPSPTVTVTPTPTPLPVVADFSGSAWVDAKIAREPIQARIGDVICGEANQGMIPDGGPMYDLRVASDSSKPGCGKPGDIVTFFIGDRQANQTGVWQPISNNNPYQYLTLIAGPPFAQIWGEAVIGNITGHEKVAPYVGNVACGYQTSSWLGSGPSYGYQVVIYSRELQAGCGFDGAEVTFKLLNEQGNVIAAAPEKGVWRVWDGTGEIPRLDLTMSGISAPSVGEGQSDGFSTKSIAALGLLGVLLIAAAVSVRRLRGRVDAAG